MRSLGPMGWAGRFALLSSGPATRSAWRVSCCAQSNVGRINARSNSDVLLFISQYAPIVRRHVDAQPAIPFGTRVKLTLSEPQTPLGSCSKRDADRCQVLILLLPSRRITQAP